MIFKNKKQVDRLKISFSTLKGEHFNFDLIEKYFHNKVHKDSFQVISDRTCNDLDFQELFMFLDRTCSKVGQQYLYNKLRAIPAGLNHIEVKEKIIRQFSNDEDFRIKTQLQLDQLKKNDAYYISSLFQDSHLKPPKWFKAVYFLSAISFLSFILLFIYPQVFLFFPVIVTINLVFHYWNKKNMLKYLNLMPQLLILKSTANKLYNNSLLKKINPALDSSLKTFRQIKSRMLFFQLEARLQGEVEAIAWSVLELVKIIFLLEPILLFSALSRLENKRKDLEEVYCFVGEIDTLLSIASLRNSVDTYCLPVIKKDGLVSARHIYHPLIVGCTTNNIEVTDKSILLTGSNMSGKTSFIRTIGTNVITGMTLNTCFAEAMTMPRLHIHSAIRISDDMLNNKSYYFEEVLTIKHMLEKSIHEKHNLFLLDELFKGTNTVERISAGKAVLSALSKNQNIVFVSTHDIELTEMLSEEYELYHFSEKVDQKNIAFDYKLKEGPLKNRNAIKILQLNEYPEKIVKEAMAIAERLDAY